MKRVSIYLTIEAHTELAGLAKRHKHTITAIVRLGVGLYKLALEARANGHCIAVMDKDENVVKEIVLT